MPFQKCSARRIGITLSINLLLPGRCNIYTVLGFWRRPGCPEPLEYESEDFRYWIGLRGPRDSFQYDRLKKYTAPDGAWLLGPAGKRHSAHHCSGMDVHVHQPGPRIAGCLWLPESSG